MIVKLSFIIESYERSAYITHESIFMPFDRFKNRTQIGHLYSGGDYNVRSYCAGIICLR